MQWPFAFTLVTIFVASLQLSAVEAEQGSFYTYTTNGANQLNLTTPNYDVINDNGLLTIYAMAGNRRYEAEYVHYDIGSARDLVMYYDVGLSACTYSNISHPLKNWVMSLEDETAPNGANYVHVTRLFDIGESGCSGSMRFTFFSAPTTYTFKGETLNVLPTNIKFYMSIVNCPVNPSLGIASNLIKGRSWTVDALLTTRLVNPKTIELNKPYLTGIPYPPGFSPMMPYDPCPATLLQASQPYNCFSPDYTIPFSPLPASCNLSSFYMDFHLQSEVLDVTFTFAKWALLDDQIPAGVLIGGFDLTDLGNSISDDGTIKLPFTISIDTFNTSVTYDPSIVMLLSPTFDPDAPAATPEEKVLTQALSGGAIAGIVVGAVVVVALVLAVPQVRRRVFPFLGRPEDKLAFSEDLKVEAEKKPKAKWRNGQKADQSLDNVRSE